MAEAPTVLEAHSCSAAGCRHRSLPAPPSPCPGREDLGGGANSCQSARWQKGESQSQERKLGDGGRGQGLRDGRTQLSGRKLPGTVAGALRLGDGNQHRDPFPSMPRALSSFCCVKLLIRAKHKEATFTTLQTKPISNSCETHLAQRDGAAAEGMGVCGGAHLIKKGL